jgi:hypothetical protein
MLKKYLHDLHLKNNVIIFFLYENNKVSTFKGQDYPRVDSLVKKIESKNKLLLFFLCKNKKVSTSRVS